MSSNKRGLYNTQSRQTLRKQLRRSGTSAEAVLWKRLQRRQIEDKKFRRQVSIGRYIVDFYCPERRLAVELDGEPHFSPTIDEYEAERSRYIESCDITLIRFENCEVHNAIEAVIETIRERLKATV